MGRLYATCPDCGSTLDPGERCVCRDGVDAGRRGGAEALASGSDRPITYGIRGFLAPQKATEAPPMLVWQYEGGLAVNEYVGYDRGTHLALYPRRRIWASGVELRRHDVDVKNTRREY